MHRFVMDKGIFSQLHLRRIIDSPFWVQRYEKMKRMTSYLSKLFSFHLIGTITL